MRLFVAAALDPAVTAAAAALSDELRGRAARLSPAARITWIPEERLHVTVRFIGHADEARAEAIAGVLRAPFTVPPLDLTIAGAGVFPRAGTPQVLWAGITAGVQGLQRIEAEVSARLAAVGIPPEARPYAPHLTLARVREAAGLRATTLLDGLVSRPVGTARISAITLFESRLSPRGPTYVALQQTQLAGRG